MGRLRWLMVGLLGLSACADPKTLNGTALFVTVLFEEQLDVRAMEFIGTTPSGNDLFSRESRPLPPSPTALKSPLTARILLKDQLGGQTLVLSVFGIDALGERIEYGTDTDTVVTGREVEMTVEMKRFDLGSGGGAGGGSGGGGGAGGAGGGGGIVGPDAGPTDGGAVRCQCVGGCCYPGFSTCAMPVVFTGPIPDAGPKLVLAIVACGGKNGESCTFGCDPVRATRCEGSACRCGNEEACKNGLRCAEVTAGSYACVCDNFSQCSGCCQAGDAGFTCRGQFPAPDTTYGACGAAGNPCAACTGVSPTQRCVFQAGLQGTPGACSSSVQCGACVGKDSCCTHMACAKTGFPTCRAGDSSACVACDLLRADRCGGPLGGCMCGSEASCPFFQTCGRRDGGPPSCG